MSQLPFDWSPDAAEVGTAPLTVSAICKQISAALSKSLPEAIFVQGEVVSFAERRGHWYFKLRDQESAIDCVMWASDVRVGAKPITDGDAIVVRGVVSHWARQGRTQIRVQKLRPIGAGDRQAAFQKLCTELRALGWFDDAAKRPLPAYPNRICVLTSSAGAAIHDVCETSRQRWPACSLIIADVPVQGTSAGSAIANMIRTIDARVDLGIDAMLITRGGGSREDLDCFDNVEVARAIHECSTPIVAAIGHESDTTIAELVADRRAATPTQAMMVLLPDRDDESQRLDLLADGLNRLMDRSHTVDAGHLRHFAEQLVAAMWRTHARATYRTGQIESAIIRRQPHRVLTARRSRLESAVATLESSMQASLVSATAVLEHLDLSQVVKRRVASALESMHAEERLLAAVGPQTILSRGYSLTTDPSGRIIKRADQVSPGQVLHTKLAAGFFESEVTSVEEGGESAKAALPSGHG